MEAEHLKPMPKQVSALNTFWLIEYLSQNHSDIDPHGIVKAINQKNPYYVENLKTGKLEQVLLDHLLDTEYWFSNRFMIELYNEIQSRVPDPLIAYKMGKTSYKALPIIKTAIGVPLLGPRGIIKKIVKENSKYNRTKENTILVLEKGHLVLRLTHHEGIIINNFAMEWHRGVYEAYSQLAGATDIHIDLICVDYEKGIWDFDIRFKEPTLFSRLLKIILFNIPLVKDTIEKAEEIQLEHKEQILNRDKIIEKRTRELKEAQAKVFSLEKRLLEHHITGGFAHEMRNALSGALYELKELERYAGNGEGEDRIKGVLGEVLKALAELKGKYGISDESISNKIMQQMRKLFIAQAEIQETVANVRGDIERGLGVTNQIREYARLQEMTRGEDVVDVAEVVRRYREIYKEKIEKLGINFKMRADGDSHLRGNLNQMNSILENIVKNAFEAVEESPQKEVRVEINRVEKDGVEYLQIIVKDSGVGMGKEQLDNIFYPFYTTKPDKGTGLGLSIAKKMVDLYSGFMEVISKLNEGTIFTVYLAKA